MRASSRILFSSCLLMAAFGWMVGSAGAQVIVEPGPQGLPIPEGCLHGVSESAAEATRREEALRAMQLIYYVVAQSPARPPVGFPTWEALAGSPVVRELQNADTPAGALARKMAWGATEPLPGWQMSYRAFAVEVRFELTDTRDPCRFSYSSGDPRVVPRGPARIVPLDS